MENNSNGHYILYWGNEESVLLDFGDIKWVDIMIWELYLSKAVLTKE